MREISVVVVNYRTPGDLDNFCRSLYEKHPNRNFTLTIANVDPRADDMVVAKHWQAKPWQATVVSFPENVGYSVAVNEAASYGYGETIAIFNADIEFVDNCIEQCHQALKQHANWGVIGPRQTNKQGLITHGGIFGTHRQPAFRGWLCPDSPRFRDAQPAVTVSGAAYFVRRSIWDELTHCPTFRKVAPDANGAFLPTPFYYEETWCSYHAYAHGYEVIYFGLAHCIHQWHGAVHANHMQGYEYASAPISRELFRAACDVHGIPHE